MQGSLGYMQPQQMQPSQQQYTSQQMQPAQQYASFPQSYNTASVPPGQYQVNCLPFPNAINTGTQEEPLSPKLKRLFYASF